MRKTTQLFTLLPLAALLGGCPIFIEGGHDHGSGSWYCDDHGCSGRDEGDSCSVNVDCPNGTVCEDGICTNAPDCDFEHACPAGLMCDFARQTCIAPQPETECETSVDCLGGSYCWEGQCIESGGCALDEDCAQFGENLLCDTTRSTCTPDPGPCPDGECGCLVDADCSDGLVCELGACWDPATLCETNEDCGQGRVCDGLFCAKDCASDVACPTGQACGDDSVCRDIAGGTGECVYTSDCSDDSQCINATCFKSCADDSVCGSFEFCDHGACRADDRPL